MSRLVRASAEVYHFSQTDPLCTGEDEATRSATYRQSVMVRPMVQLQTMDSCQPVACEAYEVFETRLIRALGAMVGGESLSRALGFPSQDAFRKALHRGRVPVATFEVVGRRGRFATVIDIAAWLWRQRGGNAHMAASASVIDQIDVRHGAP